MRQRSYATGAIRSVRSVQSAWFVLCALAAVSIVLVAVPQDPAVAATPATVIAHTSVAFGRGAQTVTVPSTSRQLAIAYVSVDATKARQTVTVRGGGLSWKRIKRSNALLGDAEIWSATTGGAALSVTATPKQPGVDTELTVLTYAGTARVVASAKAAGTTAPVITLKRKKFVGLVSMVGFIGANPVRPSPVAGESLLSENADTAGDSYWVQDTTALTTGTVAMTQRDLGPTGDSWDLAAVEVTTSSTAAPPPPKLTTTTTAAPHSTVAGVVLVPIDGGTNFYSGHGYTKAAPLDNPNFFPIGIWYPSLNYTSDVTTYKSLDINMLDRPDQYCNLSLLAGTGIYAIPQYGECGGANGAGIGNESVGLFTDDEVDMNYGPGAGYTYLQNLINAVPASLKSGRFFWSNYGKGVQLWETNAQAAQFVNDYQQTVSDDFYWFTDTNINSPWNAAPWNQCAQFYGLNQDCTTDQAQRGSNYGSAIDAIRALESPSGGEPIWAFVEDGYPGSGSDSLHITPSEMNWAIWSSIIHGARGVIYFNHSFSGPAQDDNNFENPYYTTSGITPQAMATDALIKSLAPVLNDDTAKGYVTATPAPTNFAGIETMAKYHAGTYTIFADTRDSQTTTNIAATFHVADPAATSVTVVNENRTIPVVNGTFTDTFATGATVHIYQVNG